MVRLNATTTAAPTSLNYTVAPPTPPPLLPVTAKTATSATTSATSVAAGALVPSAAARAATAARIGLLAQCGQTTQTIEHAILDLVTYPGSMQYMPFTAIPVGGPFGTAQWAALASGALIVTSIYQAVVAAAFVTLVLRPWLINERDEIAAGPPRGFFARLLTPLRFLVVLHCVGLAYFGPNITQLAVAVQASNQTTAGMRGLASMSLFVSFVILGVTFQPVADPPKGVSLERRTAASDFARILYEGARDVTKVLHRLTLLEDILVAHFIGATSAWALGKRTTSQCQIVAGCCLVIATLHLGYLIVMRPFRGVLEQLTSTVLAAALWVLTVLGLATHFVTDASRQVQMADASDMLQLFLSFAFVAQPILLGILEAWRSRHGPDAPTVVGPSAAAVNAPPAAADAVPPASGLLATVPVPTDRAAPTSPLSNATPHQPQPTPAPTADHGFSVGRVESGAWNRGTRRAPRPHEHAGQEMTALQQPLLQQQHALVSDGSFSGTSQHTRRSSGSDGDEPLPHAVTNPLAQQQKSS